jgi:GNAT superfamily N-acetyltransferase
VLAVCTVSFLQALRSRGRYAIIQEMYVEPDERSTGMGKTVLEFVLDHAASAGC